MYQKILIYSNRFSEAEIFSVYEGHDEIVFLQENDFPQIIELINEMANRCSLKEWKRIEIKTEAEKAFQVNKRKKLLRSFHSLKNQTKTLWMISGADIRHKKCRDMPC
ncbi:hypothetical protein J7I93_20145 [Bacillus sp. ISL-47]|uniref:hypothetical protein n=1 Tax=Bacillus sp. ISL-47 TaxID=2819130 RepID=UPI001BE75BE9|nr:hypothetical protein [Bacillus sp. ISL-47]MBT2690469.1 hypothetical protein [Bacillus sp. ISL-47]MBT2710130.1 hypothetical protein [Pseudomonas sp. ISL-84]